MKFKIGSLFDGSGGFPLAASMCGIEPVWAAEVEPYPIAVTRSRFPNMKHLGSVTEVKGNEVEPVDVITFGSPCQDLSVAGKRAGLKHTENGDEETTRSGLFMEAIRIIKEMREATNGLYPRFAVWENVPGAFSSNKGEDFRIVLEEFIKIAEPTAVMPAVPKNGWPYADSYCGDGWSLAYRVFDAQFWGVPQRRRRIYLVADFRGQCAGKVSFEREGLRGYFETGRTPWKETAGDAENCVGTADCGVMPYTLKIRSGCEGGGKGALVQTDISATLATNNDQYLFQPILDDQGGSQISVRTDGKSPTLRAEMHGNVPAVMEPVTLEPGIASREGGHIYEGVCGTLRANAGDNQMAVAYAAGFKELNSAKERSDGYEHEKAPCLAANKHDACCVYSIENHPADSRVNIDDSGKVQTLTSRMGTGGGNVPMVMEPQPVYCLQGNGIDRAFYNQGQNALYDPQLYEDGTNPTLVARGPNAVAVRYIVRRLTPTECARLQGFPDKWGHPDIKTELTDEEYKFWLDVRNTHAEINGKAVKSYNKEQMLTWYNKLHTDSSEYKMWGNGIALPCALYVMHGIADALKED